MDHSDHYTPQGINSVRGIKYENVDDDAKLGITNCGPADCGTGSVSTMSSRIYAVWDWDGSMSGSTGPAILGSNLDWWNNIPDQGCVLKSNLKVWVCPWLQKSTIAFIGPLVPGLTTGCDESKFASCTDQFAPYTIGKMTQWGSVGAARSVQMSPWPGVSGYANSGWYWRTKSTPHGIDGAPSLWYVDETMQLPRNNFIVLAVAYPTSGVTFTIKIQSTWWKINGQNPEWVVPKAASLAALKVASEDLLPASQFTCPGEWYQMCTYSSTGGAGPLWFFENGMLYLRIVNPACYHQNQKDNCDNPSHMTYSSGGITVPNIVSGFRYQIKADCAGCSVQQTLNTQDLDGSAVSVKFYTATDAPPSTRFATNYGSLRTSPVAPASESVTQPSCSKASTFPYDANQALEPMQPGTPAVENPDGTIGPGDIPPGTGTDGGDGDGGDGSGSTPEEDEDSAAPIAAGSASVAFVLGAAVAVAALL